MIAVREFTSAAELTAHYRSLRLRQHRQVAMPVVVIQPSVVVEPPPPPPPLPPLEPRGPEPFIDLARLESQPLSLSGVVMWEDPPLRFILTFTAVVTNVHPTELNSVRRAKVVAHARQLAMWLAKETTSRSYPEIGRMFASGRDHTTVMYGVDAVNDRRAASPDFTALTDACKDALIERWRAVKGQQGGEG